MNKTILVHLAAGFEETEAVTIIDVLRRANFEVLTVSITGHLMVTGAHNITMAADLLYDEADYGLARMIILPGGMPGTNNLMNHAGLLGKIKQFDREKRWIGAICAAPMILGQLGLLNGRKAVCYPGFESKLTGANVRFDPYAVDEHIITGRGVGTALEFALAIVSILKDEHVAASLRSALVIPG
jgi:4-methyl-5(b-hydroxyethyl)-thiazole monophosphate biosynthesis